MDFTPPSPHPAVVRSSLGTAVLLALIASACGTTSEAAEPWCAAVGELDAAIGRIGSPDESAIREAFTALGQSAERLDEDAPEEVRKAASRVAAAIGEAAATGRPTLFEPPTATAMADLHAFAADECAYESVSVEAVDFAFTGMPASLPAGHVALSFDNRSESEEHELVLFAKAEDENRPMSELLALPEEEAAEAARPVAFTFAAPGQRSGLILDLEPGAYGIVCFVPVGGEEDGAPHFAHGMVTDFVVT